MLIINDFHFVHYEAMETKEKTGIKSMFEGSTQKLHIFPNGYGASIINGAMSFGRDELAVVYFENPFNIRRSRTKRLKKKLLKQAGNYDLTYHTPITNDVKRYDDHKEMQRDIDQISKLKRMF